MMLKAIKRIISISCAILILSSVGCAGLISGEYGTIAPNRDVTESFENYQIDPDFNYYISGSDVYPNAVIGIDRSYTLNSKLWKKVEFTPETLKDLVGDMKAKVSELNEILHGFNILDDKGNKIGDWYSILSARTTVKIEDHSVIIITPDIDTYKENGDKEKRPEE
ncbi:MAG: hypothetical protein U9M96_03415 [Thermodesulfobacteriota bacterium]|nr:hypothetical protein [Thermodesulfobacteriota bacterium]